MSCRALENCARLIGDNLRNDARTRNVKRFKLHCNTSVRVANSTRQMKKGHYFHDRVRV